jgi:hypothetical protein
MPLLVTNFSCVNKLAMHQLGSVLNDRCEAVDAKVNREKERSKKEMEAFGKEVGELFSIEF